MDQDTVTAIIPARTRADLAVLDERTVPLAGASWVFSESNLDLEAYVDLTTMGWPPLTVSGAGLEIAATCTLEELAAFPAPAGWAAHPLLRQCCTALYGSYKIWRVATVGGNIATSLAAGPMISLAAALDGVALVWRPDGTDHRVPVAQLVLGNNISALAVGEVLRAVELPLATLQSRTAYRKIALSPLGRSGAVVIGRLDADGGFVLTITAATVRPVQLRWPVRPGAGELAEAVSAVEEWFTDPHGAADWRRAVSGVLAEEIRLELGGTS